VLLADFHIHTRWSDGRLDVGEVVDLFGTSGHDVIAITDHVVNSDSLLGRAAHRLGYTLTPATFGEYRDEIEREARRAWDRYRMIVILGFELTRNAVTRNASAHALAIGADRFLTADGSVESMLERAQESGAVVVACHPHEMSEWFQNTFYLWKRRKEVAALIHRWELACRWDLFPPVARAKLPFIANSDFHDRPHLNAWKTLLDCAKSPDAVLAALKSETELGVTRLAAQPQFQPAIENRTIAVPA
jgi:hypothetical protein